MKRRSNLSKLLLMFAAYSLAANAVLASLPGPFEFSFASDLLNNVFLAPFSLGGCL